MMLIAGAIDFVVFCEKQNDFAQGGRLRRFVSSIREINGVDGRVLSSEVFAAGPDGVAVPAAPISCAEDLERVGYSVGLATGGWSREPAGAAVRRRRPHHPLRGRGGCGLAAPGACAHADRSGTQGAAGRPP
nr:hypothetical protein [Angustibacter aerolatus]